MSESSDFTQCAGNFDVHNLACSRLFDEVPCHISIVDNNFRIVDANSNVSELFGSPLSDSVESTPGEGSLFTVSLPARREQREE